MNRLSPTRSVSIAIFLKSSRNSGAAARHAGKAGGSRLQYRDLYAASRADESRHSQHGILPLEETDATPDLRALYREFYKSERFVRLSDDIVPNPRYIKGTNYCDIGVYADPRAGWIVTVAALDNLVKGAAGQAIQAMNLMLGLPEETGLTAPAGYP